MPFLLIVATLGYLSLLGIAVPSIVDRRINLTTTLVAPAIGIGVLLPIVVTFNRLGIPIAICGPIVSAVLGVLAIVCVALRRPQIPWRDLSPVLPAIAVGIALAGFPLAIYGFDWLSNSNGDMTIYAGVAAELLRHGFFHVPPLDQLLAGVDATQSMWYWEIAPPNRYGSDIFLAIVAAVVHMDPLYIYMASCVVTFAMLISSTAAMCIGGNRPRYAVPLCAILIAAASPLTLFTVVQQLIPQVSGLAAMVGFVALLQMSDRTRLGRIQRGLSLGCIVSALELLYPEIAPILLLAGAIVLPFVLLRDRWNVDVYRRYAAVAAVAAGTCLLLLNVQLATIAATYQLLTKVTTSLQTVGSGSINYYVITAGLSNAWGLMPMGVYTEPAMSITIAIGAALCCITAIASVWALPRGRFSDAMLVAVEVFCIALFARRISYALYKMVFILQPFLVPLVTGALLSVATVLSRWLRVRYHLAVAMTAAAAILATSYSTYIYLGASSDYFSQKSAIFAELLGGSRHHVLGQIRRIAEEANAAGTSAPFRSDALLSQLAILEGYALFGHPVRYVTLDPFVGLFVGAQQGRPAILGWSTELRAQAKLNAQRRELAFKDHDVRIRAPFQVGGASWELRAEPNRGDSLSGTPEYLYDVPQVRAIDEHFSPAYSGKPDEGILLETGPNLTVLNRSTAGEQPFDVRAVRWHNVKNWLALVDSSIGHPPNLPAPNGAEDAPPRCGFCVDAFGSAEPDPFNRTRIMSALGRAMLLEIFNASPTVSLRLDITASFNTPGSDGLPAVTVIGASKVTVAPRESRGAARILTPPVRPLEYRGHKYLVLVIEDRLVKFPEHRTWLMSMYGNDIELDPRRFTAFARDISVAGSHLQPPGRLDNFPTSLANPALVYSGVFEDGWMSKRFSMRLRSSNATDILRIRANVPSDRPERVIEVNIDGRFAGRFAARPGTYADVELPSNGMGEHEIEITAPATSALSPTDPRQVWGRILSIAFEKPSDDSANSAGEITGRGIAIRDDTRWYPLERYQGRAFRWARTRASLSISPAFGQRTLHVRVAPGPSVGGIARLSLMLGGQRYAFMLNSEREITIPISKATGEQDLVFITPPARVPLPGDPRTLTVRMFSAWLSAHR